METYHIFTIKKEVYNAYKKKEITLYKLLSNLKKLKKNNLTYGITIYNQICYTTNIKRLKQYIEMLKIIEKKDNKYILEENNKKSILIIKPSNIIYKTDKINPNIIYILNYYSKYLFICNFNKKDYKWVNNIE
jgi:hypothetical protein